MYHQRCCCYVTLVYLNQGHTSEDIYLVLDSTAHWIRKLTLWFLVPCLAFREIEVRSRDGKESTKNHFNNIPISPMFYQLFKKYHVLQRKDSIATTNNDYRSHHRHRLNIYVMRPGWNEISSSSVNTQPTKLTVQSLEIKKPGAVEVCLDTWMWKTKNSTDVTTWFHKKW